MGRRTGGPRRGVVPYEHVASAYFRSLGQSDAEVAEALEVYAADVREFGAPRSERAARGAASLVMCTMLARGKAADRGR